MSFIDYGDAQPAAGAPLDITPPAAQPAGNFANVPLPRPSPLDTPIDYGDAQPATSVAPPQPAVPQINYGSAQPYTPPPGAAMFAQPNTPPSATPLAPSIKGLVIPSQPLGTITKGYTNGGPPGVVVPPVPVTRGFTKGGPAGPAPQGTPALPVPTDLGKIAQAAGRGFDEGTGGPPMGAPGTPLGDALQKMGVIVPGSIMAPFNSMLAQTIGGIYSLPFQAVPGAINAAQEAIREAAYQAATNAGASKDKANAIADDFGGTVEMEVARRTGNAGEAHAPEAVKSPTNAPTALEQPKPDQSTVPDAKAAVQPPSEAAQPKPTVPASDAAAQAAIEGRDPTEKSAPKTPDDILSLFKTLEGSGEHAVSKAGAVGTWQIEPGTARQYGYDPTRLNDPIYNRTVAAAILADLSKRYNGDIDAMAVAYNAGPGVADKWIKAGRDNAVLPAETQKYLAHAQSLGGGEAASFKMPVNGEIASKPRPVPMPDLDVPDKELVNDSNAHAEPGVDPVEVKEAPLDVVKAALAPKDVQDGLNLPVKIDRSRNVKEGAGSSEDGKTIFLDKNMPKEITFKAVNGLEPRRSSFDPAESILVHERVEKSLLDAVNPKTGEKYSYDEAHPIALAAEHAWIRENIGSPGFVAQYEEQLKGWIKHDEGETGKDFAPVDPRQSGNPKEAALKVAPASEPAVSGALSEEAAPESVASPTEKKKAAKQKDVSRETVKPKAAEGNAVPEDGHAKDVDAKSIGDAGNGPIRSAEHTEAASTPEAVKGKDAADQAAGNHEAEGDQGHGAEGAEVGVREQGKPAGLAATDGEGRSKIGKSIEAKAVEGKLTASFKDTAGYDQITIKDQAKRATDLIRDDIDKARAIVRGEEPLPDGLRGTALITAMEEHIKAARDGDLAYELANSPLVSMTSAAAQEMRLAAERSPDSAAAKLQEIRDALVRRAGGEKKVAPKKRIILDRLKADTAKVNLSKEDLFWNKFLDSISEPETKVGQTAGKKTAPTFYSAAVRAVENAKIVKGTPDQWLATIKNTPGVKQEELDWMGLGDWLKAQTGTVTRDQVANFVRANQIEVKDVEKSGDLSYADVRKSQGISASAWDNMSESERRDAHDAAVKESGATKFVQYQLAGGENYRELLLTLPPEQFEKEIPNSGGQTPFSERFHTPHFDEPNILAHVRMNDRVDAAGKKTLFFEEVQSDWHQAGRKKGYASDESATGYTVRHNADGSRSILDQDGRVVVERTFHNEMDDRQLIADRVHNVPGVFRPRAGVPDAPFKTTWPELALKRMIRYAAENGYDQVAWTPGDIQNDRYDLSKQIDALDWRWHRGEQPTDDTVTLNLWKDSKRFEQAVKMPWKDLPDHVGKDMADKIAKAAETNSSGSMMGVDLRVGGEGMRGFYDRILPNAANKIGKKFGAKVGETKIATARPEPSVADVTPDDLFPALDVQQAVHSLPITDAMRESVTQEGQPLFQRTPTAAPVKIINMAAEVRERLIRGMQTKVTRLIGSHAEVSFEPTIPVHEGIGDAEYQAGMDAFSRAGGTVVGETAGGEATVHSTGEALIRLAYDDPKFGAIGSARHEALHIAHALLMDDAENAVLHEPENVTKLTQWAAKELGMDPNGSAIAALPIYEKLAIGFEHFDRLRDEGKPLASIRGVPAFMMRFWEKLRHLSAEIRRMLTGQGFTRVEDIFEDLSRGKMAERNALAEPRRITDPTETQLGQTATKAKPKEPALSPEKIADFRKALKDKDIKIADLLNMSTEDRTALLRKYAASDADAKALNTQFEQKLVLKNRMQGIKNWAAKLGEVGKYSKAGKAAAKQALEEYKAAQSERVFSPKQNEAFLNDLADKTLGTHVSRDVAQKVFDLSAKADALKNVNPKLSGVSDEYLLARNELHDFVASHKNTSVVKSMGRSVVTIARNNLLFNPSTPLKTAVGQTVNSAMDMITRRVGARAAYGLNRDLARQANGEAWETFRKTGLNTASMERMDDDGKLGERQNFANPAGANTPHPVVGAAEATLRNAAKFSNKIVIDWEHNYAFTKFYQKAFFDMTNITSSGIAKSEGLSGAAARSRAGAIFKDAARIEPETREGAMVRLEAQKQAARITSTNPTMVSRLSLGAKNWLNSVTPDFPLGDILIPIAKIPANIIANGIDNAGVGLFPGVRDIFQGRAKIQSDDLHTRYEGMAQFASGIQRVTRVLGVMTAAAFFTSQLRKEDFRSDPWGNHFVKIGKIWINMEYINAVSPALAGMMEVKQKSTPRQGIADTAGQYTSGSLQGLKSVPGIDEAEKLVTAITNSNYTKGIMKYGKDLFTSRGEPAFIKALLSDRPIERLFFGATGVETDDQLRQDKMRAVQKAAASRAASRHVALP